MDKYITQFRKDRQGWFRSDAAFIACEHAWWYITSIVGGNVATHGRIVTTDEKAVEQSVILTYPPVTLLSELHPAIIIPDDDPCLAHYLAHLENALSDWAKFQVANVINQDFTQLIAYHLTGEPWLLSSFALRHAVMSLNLIQG